MPKIKTRDVVKGTVKTIDKSATTAERMKQAFVRTKDKAEHSAFAEENSPGEYAADRISGGVDSAAREVVHQFDKQGRKGVKTTKENISKAKEYIQTRRAAADQPKKQARRKAAESVRRSAPSAKKTIKTVDRGGKTIKQTAKSTSKGTVKTARKTVKTAERTAKTTIKTTQQAAKTAQKTAQATRSRTAGGTPSRATPATPAVGGIIPSATMKSSATAHRPTKKSAARIGGWYIIHRRTHQIAHLLLYGISYIIEATDYRRRLRDGLHIGKASR